MALFGDSCDNSHIHSAESHPDEQPATAVVHTPYVTLDVSAHVTFVMTQPWCHKVLVRILITELKYASDCPVLHDCKGDSNDHTQRY